MDEKLLRQLVRQMKIMNVWITVFGSLFLLALLVAGFILFQIFMFMRDTKQSIDNLQNSTSRNLDIHERACGSKLMDLIPEMYEYCK